MTGVFVVGSINQDFVLRLERRPNPGETVTGADLALSPGGKGANQAVAAARSGAPVAMLARIGEDAFGAALLENLRDNRVDTSRVEAAPGAATGSAFITVTPDGENAIVVSPGANHRFGPEAVEAAAAEISSSAVVLAQLEVSVEAVDRASRIAQRSGSRFVLNLAPAREVPEAVLRLADPLVVNEHEARFLLGGGELNPEKSAEELLALGAASVVVTLGAAGAVLATGASMRRFPAPKVEVVDTTGAGDAFVGALAAKLAGGTSLGDAVPYAVLAGAVAVTREGAQGSLPMPEEVEEFGQGL